MDEKALELLPAVIETLAVSGIDNPDERVGLLEVVLPVRAEGLLAADVPCGCQPGMEAAQRGGAKQTDVQFVATLSSVQPSQCSQALLHSPVVVDRFDDKSQRRTDTVHIFVHDPLHYRGLSSVVETSSELQFQLQQLMPEFL